MKDKFLPKVDRMNNFETVENHILSFPMEERFMLAQSLIQSLSGYYPYNEN